MKRKSMLMVTSLYPYGKGEAFVAAELEHVSRYFDDLQVAPVFYSAGSSPRTTRYTINPAYADKRWGALRALRVAASLLTGLFRYRWKADLVSILSGDDKLESLKELIRSLYRARMFERFLTIEARKNKGAGFDVIYFYWLVPEIVGALQFREATGSAVRIVCRAHNGDLYQEQRAGSYVGLMREIVTGIDGIYCISDHGRHYLGQHFPALVAKFHTARLGVKDPGFLNTQPSGALSIVSCSFVVPCKRLPLLVDAIACMLAADPSLQVRWTHVGDGPLFDSVRSYAASRLGPRAQCVFKGYLTQEQLMALYRDEAFDVIVNVSDAEGIPVSLMEASATGIPMVATDVGGNSEIVNASNGALIPADADPATIAAAILRVGQREAGRIYRREARRFWEERFNAPINYEQFGRILAGMPEPEPEPELRTDMPWPTVLRAPHGDPTAG